MTEPATAAMVPAGIADPARAAEAQASLRQLLRLVNILSGSLPGPNMGRDATRDVLLPRLRAVEVSIAVAGAEALLASRCTAEHDFFGGELTESTSTAPGSTSTATITTSATPAPVVLPAATGPTTTTAMGDAASMADRLSLAADATSTAERQAVAIVVWGAGHATELAAWWGAFSTAVRSLIDGVNARVVALRNVVSATGLHLRNFFVSWAVAANRQFDSLVTALGIGAGLGAGAGILFLAFLLMVAVRRST